MTNIYLKVPTREELHYRKEWLQDKRTMSYNAGFDIKLEGYDKNTGTITKTDKEMIDWYDSWINKEPNKYFAYIYDKMIDSPIGEIYYYLNNDTYSVGILIQDKYRGRGYSPKALVELEKIAFEKNNLKELSDFFPSDRISAIKSFKRAGFIDTNMSEKNLVFGKEVVLRKFLITKDLYFSKK